jgi:hypothetical protein
MRTLLLAGLVALATAGCATSAPSTRPTPDPSPAPSAAASAGASAAVRELPPDVDALDAGRYAQGELLPGVTFEVEDGWSSGPLGAGSLELRTTSGDGTVVIRLVHIEAESAAAATSAVEAHDDVQVLAASESRMSGLTGPNLELEHAGTAPVDLLATASTPLRLEPGQRAWLSMFDTPDGVVAIAVISDADTWDAALLAVEPFLEQVSIDG